MSNAACRRAVLFLFLAFAALQSRLDAQTIKIKLMNGRDGRPIANKWVDLGIGNIVHMLTIPTDKEGVASFRLTDDNADVNTGVANPVVKYSDNFRVHAPFALCQPNEPNYSWLAIMVFSTKDVLQQGIVRANTCGKTTAAPVPGEVIIFVRPLTFWEELKQ
jgi:hypothetical protein